MQVFNTDEPLSESKMSANMKLHTDSDICKMRWRKRESDSAELIKSISSATPHADRQVSSPAVSNHYLLM